jgi:pimeloyl-ACP methyl ester carboxylesterase
MATKTERSVRVDGLNVRYLEEGSGPAVLLLHGAALGSSADVWESHLAPLAAAGLRAVAYDRPGYGRTDDPKDPSPAYQQRFILEFMDALGIDKAGLVGHSQTGNFAIALGLEHPERVSRIMVLGTGSMLPPLETTASGPAPDENVHGREPTRDDVRKVLESQLFDHSIITPELIETRYQMSLGHKRADAPPAPRAEGGERRVPAWQRLNELTMPLILVYGADDRGSVRERVPLFRERYPNLDLRVLEGCKHLVQLDKANEFRAIATEFFAGK